MRFAPLTFIKPDELKLLHERIVALELQVTVATDFVKEIEKGNWEAVYDLSTDKNNALQDSLLSLRTQLQNYALQEKERNWVTEGLAKFIDILRSKNEDISELTDNIIRNLVKYMGANQGALYLVNDDNVKDTFIEMTACYAYDRKKFMHQRIEIGEGLAGQAILEKDVIYLTEIPKSYMRITSGLGDASPSNLLIVPLKIEEKVFGVVEIASFKKIEKYQIEFVQRLGESIASTLSTVKVNQRTHKLLQETQVQAEQMRSQEEEMRQNMEELSATQEEMQRVLKEVQDKEKYLNDLLSVTSDSIFTVGKDYKVISYNESFVTALQGVGITNPKGLDMLSLYANDPTEKEKQKSYYDRALKGEKFETTSEYEYEGKKSYYTTSFAPMMDEAGKIVAVASFSKDVTAVTMAQKETERLLKESKAQAEEMRAQEEEIRQNMEELSATQEEMQRILKEVQGKEKYLSDLLSVSKDSIFTVDKNYKIVNYNQSLATALEGIGIKQAKGFDLLSIYPDIAEREKQKSYYDRAWAGESFETTSEFEYQGVTSYHTTSFAPLRDAEGKVIAVASFSREVTATITAQKEIEKALSEVQDKEKFMTDMLNVSKDSIFVIDKEYKISHFNQAMAVGLEAMGIKDLKGFDILSLYPDAAEKKKQQGFYDRAFKGENYEDTNEYTTNGVTSYYTVNYAPLRNSHGEVVGVANFAKDTTAIVSAQKQAEKLLLESKQQSEELRAQEEEIRQNMEELSATQEEMQRVLKDVQEKERYLSGLINASEDSILTVDRHMKVINCNETFRKSYSGYGFEIAKGFDINNLFANEEDKKKYAAYYKRVFKGESFKVDEEYTFGDIQAFYTIQYSPIKNEQGDVVAAAVFVHDATQLTSSKKEIEKLLAASTQAMNEIHSKERYLDELINVTNDSIFTVDRDFKIVSFNQSIAKAMEASGVTLQKGTDLLAGLPENEKKREIANYKRAFKGESFEAINEITVGPDQKLYFAITYAPLHDADGKISVVAVFSKDVTALHNKK